MSSLCIVVKCKAPGRLAQGSSGGCGVFMRFQRKRLASGEERIYASLCRCDWVGGRPRQTTVAYLGRVEEDQVPFLKAAYSKRKPRLVWDDDAGS